MDPQIFSRTRTVRRLTEADIPAVLTLCRSNPLFYRHHPPMTTADDIRGDLTALPPGKTMADKYYLGFFSGGHLDAVLDLILDYPTEGTAFLGFFMLDAALQGRGTGSALLGEIRAALRAAGYARLRLAIDEGNPQSEAFWTKNGFVKTSERFPNGSSAYLPMVSEA